MMDKNAMSACVHRAFMFYHRERESQIRELGELVKWVGSKLGPVERIESNVPDVEIDDRNVIRSKGFTWPPDDQLRVSIDVLIGPAGAGWGVLTIDANIMDGSFKSSHHESAAVDLMRKLESGQQLEEGVRLRIDYDNSQRRASSWYQWEQGMLAPPVLSGWERASQMRPRTIELEEG